jgi:hypothetical protein
MAELRGGRDESDDGDSSARRFPADASDGAREDRPRREPPLSRAEQADLVRQNTTATNADQAEEAQKNTGRPDADPASERPGADVLERFDPRRAGLPEVTHAEAAAYIEEHLAERPWLGAVRDCSPDAQRVFVALDQGNGHAHIRHDGWVTEEMNERRVCNLEDPAQLDPGKREAHVDGLADGAQSHWCGRNATRITDPEVFATAFARGVEHPDVKAALDATASRPGPVTLPISDLLGDDGHRFCSGWQLEPVNGSMREARTSRDAWAVGDRSGPEPRAHPVETFAGGTVTFAFQRSAVGGYEVSTMYVNPPYEQPTQQGRDTR